MGGGSAAGEVQVVPNAIQDIHALHAPKPGGIHRRPPLLAARQTGRQGETEQFTFHKHDASFQNKKGSLVRPYG